MRAMDTFRLLRVLGLMLVVASLVYYFLPGFNPGVEPGGGVSESPLLPLDEASSLEKTQAKTSSPAPDNRAQAISFLQSKYGKQIAEPLIQVRFLQSLIKQLRTLYGEQWQDYVYLFLQDAFPQ